MKNLLILFSVAALTLFGSCREQKTETVIREVRVEKEATPKQDGILERAGKKVDQKVNEKIDEKIDEID
ncbi:MAG TPA: hypothetical protein VKX40_11930 [Aequorivita sp.]|nr:hypothetical protein [Aequorivita sp.]